MHEHRRNTVAMMFRNNAYVASGTLRLWLYWFVLYTLKFMELCTTLLLFKYTAVHSTMCVFQVMVRDMLHKSCIFIWCLVPFEGHFLTMPQKCHSAGWSGLDSGRKAKKRKKKWEGENLLRRRKNVLFFYISRLAILALAYLSKGCALLGFFTRDCS